MAGRASKHDYVSYKLKPKSCTTGRARLHVRAPEAKSSRRVAWPAMCFCTTVHPTQKICMVDRAFLHGRASPIFL